MFIKENGMSTYIDKDTFRIWKLQQRTIKRLLKLKEKAMSISTDEKGFTVFMFKKGVFRFKSQLVSFI